MYRSINNRIQVIQQMWPKGKWVQRFFFLVELVFTLNSTFTQEFPIYQIPLGIEVNLAQDELAIKRPVTNGPIYQEEGFASPASIEHTLSTIPYASYSPNTAQRFSKNETKTIAPPSYQSTIEGRL